MPDAALAYLVAAFLQSAVTPHAELASKTDAGATLREAAAGARVKLTIKNMHSKQYRFSLSPNGATVAITAKNEVFLWDAHTGKGRTVLYPGGAELVHLELSEDGFAVATSSAEGPVSIGQPLSPTLAEEIAFVLGDQVRMQHRMRAALRSTD